MRHLFLEESSIIENDGEWLHEMASNNTVLEHLNFYMTDLTRVSSGDLERIARRCPSLASVKISECDISDLIGFFRAAVSLEEFAGGSFSEPPGQVGEGIFNEQLERYGGVSFPKRLSGLGITYLGKAEMPIIYPVASRLKKLDLLYALLDTESHCILLQRCPNLEFLEVNPKDVLTHFITAYTSVSCAHEFYMLLYLVCNRLYNLVSIRKPCFSVLTLSVICVVSPYPLNFISCLFFLLQY